MVINWPNFNIVVSQGISRPKEERERERQPVSRAVRTHRFIKVAVLYGQFVAP